MTKYNFELDEKQCEAICFEIGKWYLKWKDKLINSKDQACRLAQAKEDLKIMICGGTRNE